MAFYGKEFKYDKAENAEGFVDSLGLPEERKAKMLSARTSKKIEKNADGTFSLTAIPATLNFKSGVEFEHPYPSVTAKITVTVDGNTVTLVHKLGDVVITNKLEFTDNDLVETVTSNKWDGVCKVYYKA